jgi:hypothetical protein|tara:strand:- start:450 stop:626 length:177 start_codon:yes stop_codon:yes gene_type:complete
METITIDKQIIFDLSNLIEEIQLKLESLELMNNPKVMKSLNRSKEQIKNREFANWDEL